MGIDIDLGNNNPKEDAASGAASDAVSAASNHEILLAELAFTNPLELPKVVESNLNKLDDEFYLFLKSKIEATKDAEEKETLTLLRDAVTDLMQKMVAHAMRVGDVSQEEVESAGLGGLASFNDEDLAIASYDSFIDKLRANSGDALRSAVEAAYDRMDMRLLERLNERMQEDSEEKESLVALNNAVQETMSARIQRASAALQGILKAGDPDAMKKEMMLLNAKGGLDESVILLLEANIDQAKKAGAQPAVEVMTMLKDKAVEFKDQSMPDEIRLIRRLLRTQDKDARKEQLVDAFKPRERIELPDGSTTKPQTVNGRRFVEALRDLITKFGNVDSAFLERIDMIAQESEDVASELFGLKDNVDVNKLQDEAFHKRSISVWELESIEEGYEQSGQKAPWHFPSKAGWDEDGNMVIGGSSLKKNAGNAGDSNIIF
eukprot:CAMPEP_0181318428 /NCGR_PEP_ID=MMETSP1101-20121128/16999_1 /TAXON_ID=46948 /ORGANISM="Rhodomonas abbreviata, Strain Caron Lab Isolate" /LENGTH=433 /DNA_ID=CAMNT_0023425893 /DNA_START=374 /DNA_END=1675 /DNA_ORIENTATION=+